ncbi:hypothetical protein B9Z55_008510 [Caenorhabditis nigoni]|uniref:Uncharacterized protein n=1 Tax=Caenorhabditis nigoni TaxID=1611254 RepID=A0A2G5UMV4_9PELO|nr:hypothetical protein B9Z55_008510 [Caenorhabditis nigoni]
MRKQVVLIFLLIFVFGLSFEVSEKPKSSKPYNSETSENVLSDTITEKAGNPEVDVIDGNYNGNQTKIRTARIYYGYRRRIYARRRFFYRPRYYYYYGGYGYGYGYDYYSYYSKAK